MTCILFCKCNFLASFSTLQTKVHTDVTLYVRLNEASFTQSYETFEHLDFTVTVNFIEIAYTAKIFFIIYSISMMDWT